VRHFCTYFDRNYLPRGLALYHSLIRHCPEFHLYVLAMDEMTRVALEGLRPANLTVISLAELEAANPHLALIRASRSSVEYYYTCGPSWLLHLLKSQQQIDLLIYLDADLFFFSDPAPLFDEMETYSIALVEHRLSAKLRPDLSRYGRYNVGWVAYRRDQQGLECLQWWAASCLEWCYDRVEDDRFADQKYLEAFPDRFSRVCILQHKGANLAPWNISNYRITVHDDGVWVDDVPLLFFNFHGFKVIAPWLFDSNLGWYRTLLSGSVRRHIFLPYIEALRCSQSQAGLGASIRESSRGFGSLTTALRSAFRISLGLVSRSYIVNFR